MLCKELILPRDFGSCTDIERSEAQPRALQGAVGRRPAAPGPGSAFGDGGGRAESRDPGCWGWSSCKGEAKMRRVRGR